MAEDFGAQPNSPQVACLRGLRESDLVVLILGERYGAEQASGLSATHEEYREAKTTKPVIAFVQEGVDREPRQADFVDEVQGWSGGLFRGGFSTSEDLSTAIIRALHDYAMANVIGPVDEAGLIKRSLELLPTQRQSGFSGAAMLNVAVVGGPTQSILRPAEIEQRSLWDELHQVAMFGDTQVFDETGGVAKAIKGAALTLSQGQVGASIRAGRARRPPHPHARGSRPWTWERHRRDIGPDSRGPAWPACRSDRPEP